MAAPDTKVEGSFTATGPSAAAMNDPNTPYLGLMLWGTFVGTVAVERSHDGGATWLPVTTLGSALSFTAPCCEPSLIEDHHFGAQYRVNCTAYTSGTINFRLSQ